jgi:hypothetical protein
MCWFAPLIILAIAVKGALVMFLWNALIPSLFQGPVLDYPQAIGLMLLAKLLVGFGGRFGGGGHWGRHGHHHHHRSGGGKDWMRSKFCKMSEEERQELREGLRKRWDKE